MLKSLLKLAFFNFFILAGCTLLVYAEDSYEKGKILFETRCSVCHKAYKPTDYTFTEWKSILNRMGPRASLRPEEMELIKQYLKQSRKKTSEHTEK